MPAPFSLPRHVAIIMDGNRRWSKQRGVSLARGYLQGAQRLRFIAEACCSLPISHLTVFAFSMENWSRPQVEIDLIFRIFHRFLQKKQQFFHQEKVRFLVIGQKERLPPFLAQKITDLERATSSYTRLCLQVAVSYGSRFEIIQAIRAIAQDVARKKITPQEIDEYLFEKYLYSPCAPDPDFLIRTSGEQRLSNYLLWQTAYTELLFVQKMWPDFTPEDFQKALHSYSKRCRRFGGHGPDNNGGPTMVTR